MIGGIKRLARAPTPVAAGSCDRLFYRIRNLERRSHKVPSDCYGDTANQLTRIEICDILSTCMSYLTIHHSPAPESSILNWIFQNTTDIPVGGGQTFQGGRDSFLTG